MSNPGAGPDGAPSLTIGAVAKLTGKSASAIRYYDQATLRTLAVIETAQRAGLALDEIKVLLSAAPGDPAAVERLREVASRKLPEIIALIERTELVRGWLECAARCECPDLDECPLFDEPSLPPVPAKAPAPPKAPAPAKPRASAKVPAG